MAQPQPPGRSADIPTLELPALDNAMLLAIELEARKPGRAPAFAEVRPVSVRPTDNGVWTDNGDGTSTWQLRVNSPTAHSINLGFTEYWMPAGGELYLTTGKKENWQVRGPFTPADNEAHNQLWTPMVDGDELVIQVNLPTAERENLRLWLTHVNHDFLDFNSKSISGSCNLDVVCGAADGYPIVDLYGDIIRSVAVFGTGGGTFCTGFLVNNTRNDGTPYFMTANHCGINAGNAPSLVTYWNFENSTCRTPGSAASGGAGDGNLNTFNTGSIWRASNPGSDMTIVELDDPVNPDADGFFAGWDNSYDVPTDTVIGIHHPRTDEKRISFTFQQTFFTNGFNGPADAAGTHLEVPDWDIGTTEPGSSGSPLFDRFHRVRGQLHGGGAACGNDLYDTYGSVARSWEGGGTPSSRLSDWLDPDGLGVGFIDGRDVNAPQATIIGSPIEQSVCGTDASVYNIVVGGGFAGDVQLSIEDLPAGLNASYSQNPATPGSTVQLTITPNGGTEGAFAFTLAGENGPDSDEVVLRVTVTPDIPDAVALFSPANVEENVSLSPTLSWGDILADNYEYELALDNTFTNIISSGTTAGTAFTQQTALEQGTFYFWRVRAMNACGEGEWSAVRGFMTLTVSCRAGVGSTDVPVNISTAGTPEVTSTLELPAGEPLAALEVTMEIEHTFVGDLSVSLTSPDGITVVLLDRIGVPASGFGCPNDNLSLTFSDLATATYADLETTCNAGAFAAEGTFQPAEALAMFNGEAPIGEWTLTINDNANQDGGDLISWGIIACEAEMTLPVELSSFTGVEDGCDVRLKWTSELEENFSHYELEQSTDGRRFTTTEKILPNAAANYDYEVKDTKGTRFFRLKIVDNDDTFSYSSVVTTSNDCGKTGITALYPNPTAAGTELTVQFDRPLQAESTLRVFSADGRQIFEQAANSGLNVQRLDVSKLPAGTYFLRVISGAELITESFVVSR